MYDIKKNTNTIPIHKYDSGFIIIKIFQLKDNENKKDDYVLFDSIDYAIKI